MYYTLWNNQVGKDKRRIHTVSAVINNVAAESSSSRPSARSFGTIASAYLSSCNSYSASTLGGNVAFLRKRGSQKAYTFASAKAITSSSGFSFLIPFSSMSAVYIVSQDDPLIICCDEHTNAYIISQKHVRYNLYHYSEFISHLGKNLFASLWRRTQNYLLEAFKNYCWSKQFFKGENINMHPLKSFISFMT